MWLYSWSSISSASSVTTSSSSLTCWPFSTSTKPQYNKYILSTKPIFFAKPRRSSPTNTALKAQLSDHFAQIVHNKVLVAAGVSAAIGQLSKPFTSVLLYGKDFDIKSTVQAGGFPSTHSSAVVAAATCLGLERGFSDSIFGLTVVYAGLVMYDAQGVRREVGIHARTLNKIVKSKARSNIPSNDKDGFDSQQGTSSSLNYLSDESDSFTSKARNHSTVLVSKSEKKTTQMQVLGDSDKELYNSLKESIGHTEVEVVAGAMLGFLVSLAVNTLI